MAIYFCQLITYYIKKNPHILFTFDKQQMTTDISTSQFAVFHFLCLNISGVDICHFYSRNNSHILINRWSFCSKWYCFSVNRSTLQENFPRKMYEVEIILFVSQILKSFPFLYTDCYCYGCSSYGRKSSCDIWRNCRVFFMMKSHFKLVCFIYANFSQKSPRAMTFYTLINL